MKMVLCFISGQQYSNRCIGNNGVIWLVEVIWILYSAEKTQGGPKFKRYRSDAKSLEVSEIVSNDAFVDLPVLKLRRTSRGWLKVRAFCLPVHVWTGKSDQA